MLEFSQLNNAQREAVAYPFDRALKITAGAGTGKTSVITFRFLEALKRIPRLSPSGILCLTFTDRAADSMRDRIVEALGDSAQPEDLWINTFHSFCARILARYPALSGFPQGYRVAGEAEIAILRDNINASILSDSLIPPEERSLIPPGALGAVIEAAWRFIDGARGSLHTPETFEAALNSGEREDTEPARYGRQVGGVALRLFHEYHGAKQSAGVVDYADLVNGLYWLLERHSGQRKDLSSQFTCILVDEFQDTDRAQLELLRLIAKKDFANVTIVGDDKQAIYEWRGARIENLREFRAEERLLTFNYRSYNDILDLANFSITRDPYFAPRAKEIELENPEKGSSEGGHVRLVRLADREAEANYIAGEINELLSSGIEPGRIAVLYRATTHTRILENHFRRLGMPYTALGAGFFEREEVRDILAYLKLAADPDSDRAAVRVLERPPVLLTQAEVVRIAARRDETVKKSGEPVSLLDSVNNMLESDSFDNRKRGKVESAVECIKNLRSMRRITPLAVLVEKAFHESGYHDMLLSESSHEAPRSISNVSKIVDLAMEFQSRSPLNGLPEFVHYMERLLDLGWLREAEADPQEESDAVQLLTIHGAKGLEFHTVFLADVRDKKFRKDAPFLLDLPPACDGEVTGRVAPKRLPGSKDETREYKELLELRSARERHGQEERRTFYVALTRAQENLYLTTTVKNSGFFDELTARFKGSELVEIIDTTPDLNA
jgi:DNA helicase-2/ATP-dependent DNA helicase PcrA